jgi:hypothetical protein
LTASAENSARQIIDACRYGDPDLTITLPARLAIAINHLAPSAVARAMIVANRFLPGPNGVNGDQGRRGGESTSKWAPSTATVLTDKAAVMNNEV